jgi:hypothetical protein
MFKQETKDAINGWGSVLRFITPLMVMIGLWIMSDMKNEMREIRQTAKEIAQVGIAYNTEHLKNQVIFEKEICQRVASLETYMKKR